MLELFVVPVAEQPFRAASSGSMGNRYRNRNV